MTGFFFVNFLCNMYKFAYMSNAIGNDSVIILQSKFWKCNLCSLGCLPIESLSALGYDLFSAKQQYDHSKWWTAIQSNLVCQNC